MPRTHDDDDSTTVQAVLNAIVDPVCSLDRAGRVTVCNDAFLRVTGYRTEEMLGNTLHRLVHHRILDDSKQEANSCLLCTTPNNEQELHIAGAMVWRKDGTQFPAEYWSRPMPSSAGGIERIVTLHDMSERLRANESFRRTQGFLNESQRLMHIGSWSWKTDQREKVDWSPEHFRIFGLAPRTGNLGFEESLGQIHPDDVAAFRRLVKDSIAAKSGFETEARIVRPDGSVRNIRGMGRPVLGQDGQVMEFVGTTIDITERKRAERELRLAQFSLEHDSNPVHWVDPGGHIVYANQGTCRALGYSREEVASLSVWDIAPTMTPPKWQAFWETLKQRGAMHLESENKSKQGRVFPVEVNATYLEFDGQEYVFAFVRDITERKQIEERLLTLSGAVEQSPASVVITDTRGTIEYVNPKFTQVTGYSREEAVGKNPRILKSGMQSVDVYRQLWTDVLNGKEWRGELVNRKKTGEIYWEAASIVPIKSPAGSITHLLGIKEDITQQKRAESALRESEKRYRLLFERNLAGVFRTNLEGQILQCNQAAARILGYRSPAEVLPLTASSLYEKPSDRELFLQELTSRKNLTNREMKYRCKSGGFVSVIANYSLVEDDPARGLTIEGTFVDITERKLAENRVHALAYYDPLTGLPNRTLLNDRLSQALAAARRHGHKVVLFFADLDRFKLINDSLGHAVGDLLLKQVAIRLQACVRETDTVARLGGDEFVIVLTHVNQLHETTVMAERLTGAMIDTFDIQGHALNISCSLGISIFPEHGFDSEALIKNADAAMYMAKQTGRNNSQLFTPDMSTHPL